MKDSWPRITADSAKLDQHRCDQSLGSAEGMEIISVLERYRKMNLPVRYAILAIGNSDETQLFEDDYMGGGSGGEIPDDSLPDGQT